MSLLTEIEAFVNGLPDSVVEPREPLVDTTCITACFKARYHQDLIIAVFSELYRAADNAESFGYHVHIIADDKSIEIVTDGGKTVGEFTESKGTAYLHWIRSIDDLLALDRLSDEVVLKEAL